MANNAPYRGQTRSGETNGASVREVVLLLPVVLAPFWNTYIMKTGFFGVDALRLSNMVPVIAFLTFAMQAGSFRASDAIERGARLAFLGYLAVFAIAFARSVPNLPHLHAIAPEFFPTNVRTYVDGSFVVPLLMSMSFIYVLRTMCSSESLVRLFSAMALSLFALSSAVILLVAADPSVLSTPNRVGMMELTETQLGMHYNSLSTFYVILAPAFAYFAAKKGGWWSLNYIVALVAVLVLESRTALALFVAMSIVALLVMGRARLLLVAVPSLATAAVFALGPILIGVLTTGFSGQSGFSLDRFLTGRDQLIWLPLIFEWWNDPRRFWLGAGELGMLTSDVLLTGRIFAVTQAHNAYLEFFLDCGIAGFAALLASLGAFLWWAFRMTHKVKSQLCRILLLCVLSFLLSCLVNHNFFPQPENMFVFPVIAAFVNVVRLKLRNRTEVRHAFASEPAL